MNSVQLIGRLTADPELKHTQSGTALKHAGQCFLMRLEWTMSMSRR